MKYYYKARDWNGKLIKGAIDSPTKLEVLESIKANGLTPLSIEEKKENILMEMEKKLLGRVGLKQISNFTRQLSTMMTAGLPLTDALSLLKNQMEERTVMYEILDYCLNTVRGGRPLGEALEKYQDVFGDAYIASINAGEQGGVLEEVLQKLADNLEKQDEFSGKVKGAMIYPIIVIVGMFAVTVIMMVVVVPKLMGLYKDFGSKMPAITQLLIDISTWVSRLWFLFPLLVVGGYWVFKIGNQNKKFRLKRDRLLLKIPILGELTTKTIMADTMRTMAMLLTAGISLVESLKIVGKVAGNEVYYDAFESIGQRVQKGFSIANSFEETGVFPLIVNQMISTGEATGKLDEVLLKVSNYFSTEAEQSVKALTSAIEPLIMIVLGIGVAFLVVAVIMPIYNLTSQF